MKAILLLAGLMVPDAMLAQAPAGAEPPFTAASGAFFALSVADLNASTQWYTDKLGLKVVSRPPRTEKAAATILEGGGLMVELVQHHDAVPLSQAAPAVKGTVLVHGIFKVGVMVEDFERTLASLRARQIEIAYGPFPAQGDQRANVIIKDNAGNLIQFFGPAVGR